MSGRPLSFPFAPLDEDLSRCVHCGLCLQSCPTYRLLRIEADSPRGRLHLIRALTEGRIGPTPSVLEHLELCLQCRNCEAVCPSGVPFGRVMEAARAMVVRDGRAPVGWRLRRALLRLFLPRPALLDAATLLLGPLADLSHVLARLLPPRLRLLAASPPSPRGRPYRRYGLLAGAGSRRVGLFLGCVMPALYPQVHSALVRLLSLAGCSVVSPQGQSCCGALLAHNGDMDSALALARRNIDAFLAAGVEAVVVDAAGCGAIMKEYGHLLSHDPIYSEKARRFSALVRDATEFLAEASLPPPSHELSLRVTYQDPCHLAHAQGVRDAPRKLLRQVPGLALIEMEHPDRCCGSAGVYSLSHPALALQVLRERMQEVAATEAEAVVTANPGCMLQLEAGVRLAQLPCRVLHVVEVLAAAYGGPETTAEADVGKR
ncbi:MAG TPA: heterodisulfide reductase-related iron-sulfur binding cluster [Dehalococcoidia bacterium]|nr:heterodisulfide reductase-related iron-sulfur binding cluster [Dehalococcoidia bacterium]